MINLVKRNILLKILLLTVTLSFGIVCAGLLLKVTNYHNIPLNIFIIFSLAVILLYVLSFHFYVTRPLEKIIKEIKAILTGRKYNRIFTNKIDEIGVVAHFFNETTHSIERASKDIETQRRMSAELDIASKIQRDVFPQHCPQISNLTIIAKIKPAAEIGGDSYDFITNRENIFFYIGDVTGHGVPAGLVMMMVNTLINTFCDLYTNTQDIVIQTNRYLKPLLRSIMFMTLILFRWHEPTQKLFFSGGGHQHILLCKANRSACEIIKSGGIAVGMIPDINQYVKEVEINFAEGDTIILYTDGVVEAHNLSGEMYGLENFKKLIERSIANQTAEQLFNTITAELSKFTEGTIQEDDMSIIILKKTQEPLSEEVNKDIDWEIKSEINKNIIQLP